MSRSTLIVLIIVLSILVFESSNQANGLKKKGPLKKMKKLWPLLALFKSKKIILLPIPINIKKPTRGHRQIRPAMMLNASSIPVLLDQPNQPAHWMVDEATLLVASQNNPQQIRSQFPSHSVKTSQMGTSSPTIWPSLTMSILSAPGGQSAIELKTNSSLSQQSLATAPSSMSGSIVQHVVDWEPQRQQLAEPVEQLDGTHYYWSPWKSRLPPLLNRSKLFHNQQAQATTRRPSTTKPPSRAPSITSPITSTMRPPQPQQQAPIVVVENHWQQGTKSETSDVSLYRSPYEPLGQEELIPIGPPQLRPFYQTPDGQLHIVPPEAAQQDSEMSDFFDREIGTSGYLAGDMLRINVDSSASNRPNSNGLNSVSDPPTSHRSATKNSGTWSKHSLSPSVSMGY